MYVFIVTITVFLLGVITMASGGSFTVGTTLVQDGALAPEVARINATLGPDEQITDQRLVEQAVNIYLDNLVRQQQAQDESDLLTRYRKGTDAERQAAKMALPTK